jgi:hypothetical protein
MSEDKESYKAEWEKELAYLQEKHPEIAKIFKLALEFTGDNESKDALDR